MSHQDLFVQLKAAAATCSDDDFRRLVDRAMNELNMLDKDVAEALSMSRTTVMRWRNGLSVPHPLMRPAALRVFIRRCEELLKSELRRGRAANTVSAATRSASTHPPVDAMVARHR
jgi:hypothetical protein